MSNVVLLTGAAGGIGSFLVGALYEAGWRVLGTDNSSLSPCSPFRDLCDDWVVADLEVLSRDPHQLEAFRISVLPSLLSCDNFAIVHNAAFQCVSDFDRITLADWHRTINVNLMAPVAINRALLPQLQFKNGAIVHIGSIHNQLTKPGFTAYATSKAALAGLTRAMAVELGHLVRVNAIEPAAISTPMLEAGFTKNPECLTQLESFHPTRSIGSPADVARAVLFLLDPANCFLNGCILPLGGGIHSRLHDPSTLR